MRHSRNKSTRDKSRWLLAGLGVLLWVASLAAPAADDEQELLFEILVFTSVTPVTNQVETRSLDPGDPRLLNAVTIADETGTAFGALERDERHLEGSRRALERSGEYEILLHEAWRQPAMRSIHAPWVRLQSRFARSEQGPMVDGRVRVGTQQRFVQIALNLAYHPSGLALESGEEPVPAYHLDLRRRISAGEIYYLDHPRFGVLVQVREPDED